MRNKLDIIIVKYWKPGEKDALRYFLKWGII